MSWSIGEIGRAHALASKINTTLRTQGKCIEPEETLIVAILDSMPVNTVVQINAAGSQKINTTLRTQGKCIEPEETFRQSIFSQIVAILDSMPVNTVVQINAVGSQAKVDYQDPSKGDINFLTLEIKPFWNGFVE